MDEEKIHSIITRLATHEKECEVRWLNMYEKMQFTNERVRRLEHITIVASGAIISLLIAIILKG